MPETPPLRVLVAGLGTMGRSHALAYAAHPGFAPCGLVNRSSVELPPELAHVPMRADYARALAEIEADVVCIATYSDSHAEYAVAALEAGRHVFVEKPLATTVADAERVVAAARANDRRLVVGYILRHHPSWTRLVSEARALGGPYVFRLNLNQQSSGPTWEVHRRLMDSTSPIVDCGVHYVDVMCQVTDAPPVAVSGMGARLTDDIADGMYNYGHFQVRFADDVDAHTRTSRIRVHRAELDADGRFAAPDVLLDTSDEPDHQGLCDREQDFLHRAIVEGIDLSRHHADAVRSLAVCLAADDSVRSGRTVHLPPLEE